MSQCSWNTAPEKPVAKLLLAPTEHPPLYLQAKPQVASITSVYWVLGRGLALFWGAESRRQVSPSHPMPQLCSSLQPRTEGEEFDRLNKQWFNGGHSCTVRGLSELLPGDGCWATTDAGGAGCASLCNCHRTWWGRFQMRSPRAASVT